MNETSLVFSFVLAAYLIAAVLYVANLFTGRGRAGRAAISMAGAGALAHTVGLTLISVATGGRSPYSTVYGAVSFLAWLVVLMQVGLGWRWRARMNALGAFSLPIAFLMMLYALALPPTMRQIIPTLRQHTLAAHISMALLGYGAFTVAFGLAVINLVAMRLLKAKRLRGLFERLPPLRATEDLACRFATFGYAMLTLGIGIGSIYGIRNGYSWYWHDPKVLPSLITWGIYAIYLFLRYAVGWRGRLSSYLLVVGYFAVLLTFVGVNLAFPGMHGTFH